VRGVIVGGTGANGTRSASRRTPREIYEISAIMPARFQSRGPHRDADDTACGPARGGGVGGGGRGPPPLNKDVPGAADDKNVNAAAP